MAKEFAGMPLDRPLLMGIVNVTPDSFADGGETFCHDRAIERGLKQTEAGADCIDIGGQSTRPGSVPIPPNEELKRVLPVVTALAGKGIVVSVDTRCARVMEVTLDNGATIINDISSLSADSGSLDVIVSKGASVVLMHMRGTPDSMNQNPYYLDVVKEVDKYLDDRIVSCLDAGMKVENLCIDPGIGFGKTTEHNFHIINHLESFMRHPCSKMIGISRKFGLNKAPDQRLKESISLALIAIEKGINILRVHDVAETKFALNDWLVSRN